MGRNNECEKILERLFSLDGDMPADIAEHLEGCRACNEEYRALLKMRELVKNSAPQTPDMRDAVIGKIKAKNISIRKNTPSRRRVPLGTLATLVACLVVYISVYGGGIFDNIFKTADNFAECEVADECVEEYADGADYNDSVGSAIKYKANGTQGADAIAPESEAQTETETVLLADTVTFFSGSAFDKKEVSEAASPENTIKLTSTERAKDVVENKDQSVADMESFNVSVDTDGADNGDAEDAETEPEAEVEAEVEVETEAEEKSLFESFSEKYPDRISFETYCEVGEEVFAEFVSSLTDPETQYTEQALVCFAAEYKK